MKSVPVFFTGECRNELVKNKNRWRVVQVALPGSIWTELRTYAYNAALVILRLTHYALPLHARMQYRVAHLFCGEGKG